LGFEPETEVSLVCSDDAELQRLNCLYRHKDRPTDVLSFPQWDATQHGVLRPALLGDAPAVLGDIAISYDTAARQAQSIGHSLDAELQRLLVHGVLHLLGHDHEDRGPQARRMRTAERRLLVVLAAQLC
jgi:probable rRNA maturation factor